MRQCACRARNAAPRLALLAVVVGMVGLAFASVPLYRLFCQVTGFGGTPQRGRGRADAGSGRRIITVRFNADVASRPALEFQPVQRELSCASASEQLAFYRATNHADRSRSPAPPPST